MLDFGQARKAMVDNQLRPGGVLDWRILAVMARVPRERFVPEPRRVLSYADEAIAVSPTRVMPSAVALGKLIQLAEITASDVVLDVACGTGYSTAVLAGLANGVVALEDDATLVTAANANLVALDIGNAAVLQGPLTAGLSREAPFDVIVIGGSVDEVPQALLDQLREGGRLVTAIGQGNAAVAYRFIKTGGAVTRSGSFNLSLPPLEAFAKAPSFAF